MKLTVAAPVHSWSVRGDELNSLYDILITFKKYILLFSERRRLTPRDYAAQYWGHVNPYGRFALDMNARLALL